MSQLNQLPIYKKIETALKADPKKTGILTVLFVVLLVVVGRLVLNGDATPAKSSAAAAPSLLPDKPTQALPRPNRSTKVNNLASMQEWLTSQKKGGVDRNFFAVRYEYFPRDGKGEPSSGQSLDPNAKLIPTQADQKRERQILVENLQLRAAGIRLQSTMMGSVPKALVNGKLVRQGDEVEVGTGDQRTVFNVQKIEARRMIVEREGVRLEIPMH